MTDSNWNNPGLPPKKKGLSTGAKIALGCGIGFVVIVGGCVAAVGGAAWWGMKKGGAIFDQAWTDIRRDVQKVQTDEGAKALYRDNPGLSERYPTEEEFLKASQGWRAKLAQFPEKRPELKEIFSKKGGIQFQTHSEDGVKRTTIRYPLPQGGVLYFESKNDQLVDIGVD